MDTTERDEKTVRLSEEMDKKEQEAVHEAPSGVNGPLHHTAKSEHDTQVSQDSKAAEVEQDNPQGGFDSTPIPTPPPGTIGYAVKFTIHRATNLAIGDAHKMSSDPFCLSQLNTGLPWRHKEDPNLRFRTPTLRNTTEPVWNEEWIVANVPSSGFKLKIRVYDEDPADHDDILGKVHIEVPALDDNWPGIKDQKYQLRIRDSSKRALSIRTFARVFSLVEQLHGELNVSIEILGHTQEDGQNGRVYTVGPCKWLRHYSPLLGRIAHTQEPEKNKRAQEQLSCPVEKRIKRYDFQANQIQLPGPVPAKLYHRFVEFRPWVKRMFTTSGIQGIVLGKALHHQHTRVYNFDRSTTWGYFPQGPSIEMTQKFLDLVHYDQGGRIFTYVLTLDALWRFTETGKEFGIDMLSKHTMHSDVSIYIAFSGEFFIRRLKHRHRPPPPNPLDEINQQGFSNDVEEQAEAQPDTDPSRYQLVIDNDSGTYRPNAKMLPLLAAYLSDCLPGLHIQTLDCQADADKMAKLKAEQRERKKREGDNIIYTQGDDSSISSSEGERLDDIEAGFDQEIAREPRHVSTGDGTGKERGHLEQAAKQVKLQQKEKVDKIQRIASPSGRSEDVSQS